VDPDSTQTKLSVQIYYYAACTHCINALLAFFKTFHSLHSVPSALQFFYYDQE